MKITLKPHYIVYDNAGFNPKVTTIWSSGSAEDDLKIDEFMSKDVFGLKDVYDNYLSEYVVPPGSYNYDATNDLIIFTITRKDGAKTTAEDRKKVEQIWNSGKKHHPELTKGVLVAFQLVFVCECDGM